jgi:hypothetical protein
MRSTRHLSVRAMGLAVLVAPAWAGRPLATDDAVVADRGSCQVEGWIARAEAESALVLAPACGVADGLELDGEFAQTRPSGESKSQAAQVALKWVPAAGEFDTPAGTLQLGGKFAYTRARSSGSASNGAIASALALATLEAAPALRLDFNLGPLFARASNQASTLVNVAVVVTPADAALFFAEVQASDRPLIVGSTARRTGARWWLAKDEFGLDFTASRFSGVAGIVWSVGFGWYGLGK